MNFTITGIAGLIVELDAERSAICGPYRRQGETARFKRSASFRVETIAEARKFAVKHRVSGGGTIDIVGGIKTGPIASFDMDPDGVFTS